jgi:hypothetical protein
VGVAFAVANAVGAMVVVAVSPGVIGLTRTGWATGDMSELVLVPIANENPTIATTALLPTIASTSLVRPAVVN